MSGHKAEENRELSTRLEDRWIGHTGGERCGGEDANAGDRLEPLVGCVLSVQGQKTALDVPDCCREAVKLRRQCQKPDPCNLGDLEAFVTPKATDKFSNQLGIDQNGYSDNAGSKNVG